MRFLTRFSLRNPVAVVILTLIIAIGGIFSATNLKEELMPNIAFPVVAVVTPYPGASPQEVAKNVTEPLEKALRGVSGVNTVTSTSIENVSEIELQMNMSANLNTAMQKAQNEVNQVKLPSGAQTPKLQKFSFNSQPVVYFTVTTSNGNTKQMRNVANNLVAPALKGVEGVASLQTGGAQPDNVVIQFNKKKLSDHNLTMQQVLQDLKSDNTTMPLGSSTVGGKNDPVQLNTHFTSLNDIKNLQIAVPANPNAGIKQIGTGMQQLGNAVSGLGKGVSKLGQGLGAVQAENQILSALQKIQGQLFGAELSLNQEMAKPAAQRSPQKIAQLQGQIQALQKSQSSLDAKLKSLQSSLSGASSSASAPKVSGSVKTSSTSSSKKLDTIPLKDVATVSLQQPKTGSINRTNGKPSVFIGVVKTEDANTVQMATAVNKELSTLKSQLPSGVHIVPLYDSSKMITASINGMMREAILGAIFAVLVILLFLRNWLTTLIAVVSIPLSLLTAIIVLNHFNVSMNIMTLGGMAVATGRVVDDSIVVIENIYRAWRRGLGYGKGIVRYATGEVSSAITSSTITTVAVFLPLGLVSGVIGKIFFPFAITVVVALLSSLLIALTVVPMLAWMFLTRKQAKGADYSWITEQTGDEVQDLHPSLHQDAIAQHSTKSSAIADLNANFRPWQIRYQGALNWVLNHKVWVLLITIVAFVASIAVLPLAGSTFIPSSKEKFATISVKMPIGTPRFATASKAKQVERIVLEQKSSIKELNTQIGSDPGQVSAGGGVSGSNQASMFLSLKSNTDISQFVSKLRTNIKPIASPAVVKVQETTMGGSSGSFGLIVTGPNDASIKKAAVQITNSLKGMNGLANVENNLAQTRPEVSVVPDFKKAGEYGLTAYQIGTAVKNYVSHSQIGTVTLNGTSYDVTAIMKPNQPLTKLQRLKDLPLQTSIGTTIKLSDVATVKITNAPVSVLHRNSQAYAQIQGSFTTQNTGNTTKLALAKISKLSLPTGVHTQLSGSSQQQNQSFSELIDAILVAVGLVYIVMLITFGEWSAPFAILFSMPVALIGAFFGTVIGHQPVSVSSLIGILMLMGIVVTNAIVLVDRVEQQRHKGLTVRGALLEAGTTRLRPIVMTAIATICALTPLAAGFSEGALISQGLAVVVIGGLITSTVLTLVIVPLMYELLHFRLHRRERALQAEAEAL
ncbi:efflux RND transporter permease subunit [Alicyclobacillus sp. SO9]|uniref:efflux RND transporter permease subunit n=1 Tax=Alicyclobacillus sp. SO9 TaxID=2665646 RepID=UPI0018E7051C|nr:efflux RND transporter permease subunit [Alicyclobacillus sp. SO9]QQE79492.1 efflux RND transporter permease subunit [Alicyclobacillus sp. SO9]